ncbi:YceI family protein [Marinicella litoralis]|uniref:Polyisoprenoid-binding protein YceI n=1 Tax=Marinicella litoralis TaxID=644220 RepID=A0A4R6XYJ8_9GAMM|nr:YceI family protein [Marinicella litoralis]TDR23719.1 polyisoprenoid-binding protein YceI [Marinicella litoralis]
MKKLLILLLISSISGVAVADKYKIDTKGAHAFVQFKIKHLGYSWLYGRFDSFDGEFEYDESDPSKANIQMTVDTNSVNSNHAARDKHLRSDDFLNVASFPAASFSSTSFSEGENGNGTMKGNLTLNGVTKEVDLDVTFVGGGKDPWGGTRRGYEAVAELKLSEFNIKKSVGGAYEELTLIVSVEGIKQ